MLTSQWTSGHCITGPGPWYPSGQHGSLLSKAQVPPPVPILHGPASTQGPGLASESASIRCHHTSELSSYFRVRYYYTSSYFRVRDSLHPDLSPHIIHISRTFSTQIITFPGFIPSKNTVSAFILQERSPKPAENSIFHICQKITYFDIFHLFCHFLRSAKITHFHKNTKITYFHYFPLRWRKPKNHLFPQIPKNGQIWDFLENGQNQENQENGENGQIPQIPQKWPKYQKWGNWGFCPYTPKMGILRSRLTNTPHRLDVRIFLEITPGDSFYTLLLRVSIFDYL